MFVWHYDCRENVECKINKMCRWYKETALSDHNLRIKQAINFKQKLTICPPFTLETIINHLISL